MPKYGCDMSITRELANLLQGLKNETNRVRPDFLLNFKEMANLCVSEK